MLLRTEKMDALGGVVAAVCIVDDDPSMLKALERLLAWLACRRGYFGSRSVFSSTPHAIL